ncbi:hypothetical protein FG379_003620 [Cryptosporidium bovis]|uniref:uncharacterized protein n=1 Tax=Cryptosporidium bovis TaxID=310047 RepID=UPI00351A4C31|nr:hypothetical protein FG379_003620 [Cryptosporidium bovis]
MIRNLHNVNGDREELFLTPESRDHDNYGDNSLSNGLRSLVGNNETVGCGNNVKPPIDIDTVNARNSSVSIGSDFYVDNDDLLYLKKDGDFYYGKSSDKTLPLKKSQNYYSIANNYNDVIHTSGKIVETDERDSLYRRIMVSSNFVQLLPTSAYKVSSNKDKGENNNVLNEAFDVREYGVKGENLCIDFESVSREEESEFSTDHVCNTSEGICGIGETGFSNKDDAILVPNIPIFQYISYFRQEKVLNKRLNAIWLGYKTRCILRGNFGFNKKAEIGQETKVNTNILNLRYKIHEILNSIFDLYELIKDEESKENINSSWLDALYDQTKEFKRRYVFEVNRLVFSNGNKWITQIVKNKEDKTFIEREVNSNSIPSRYQRVYRVMDNSRKFEFKKTTKNRVIIPKIKDKSDNNDRAKVNGNSLNHIEGNILTQECDVLIPFDIAKTNRIQDISFYLGVPIEFIVKLAGEDNIVNNKIENQTPKIHLNKNIDYFTPKSSFTQFEQETYEYGDYNSSQTIRNENIFCTPKFDENRRDTQERQLNNSSSVKPRPYLKRKSKSILPSKETNIELKGIQSKVKEIYKNNRSFGDASANKNSIKCLNKTATSKIPGISSDIKIISDSPSSRSSSAKVSRIPKYNKGNNFY